MFILYSTVTSEPPAGMSVKLPDVSVDASIARENVDRTARSGFTDVATGSTTLGWLGKITAHKPETSIKAQS